MISFTNIGLEETSITIKDVLGYLRLEEGERLTEEALTFIGKAAIAHLDYWLWKYCDTQDVECFAVFVKTKNEKRGSILSMGNTNELDADVWLLEFHEKYGKSF
ncbi:MAG: hypothetical protein B6D75_18170 [gamma proteobacterium symbiont of Stewartia floridana]|nr:MAG: hypothetical protein B6D75_18170 [gamma proteobacterium symbiont of Stewartia floridana]